MESIKPQRAYRVYDANGSYRYQKDILADRQKRLKELEQMEELTNHSEGGGACDNQSFPPSSSSSSTDGEYTLL